MNAEVFIQSAVQQFRNYKALADKTFGQLKESDFYYAPNEESNNLAVIITHMHGNMLSRWTNFLTEDGEKEWRNRDNEFEDRKLSEQQLLKLWEEGWNVLFDALSALRAGDMDRTIFIRTKPLTVTEAVHRQLTHYASHVGQIIYIGKMLAGKSWQTLSIARGSSQQFNENMRNNRQ